MTTEWAPLLSLLAFTMVALTGASWKLYGTFIDGIDDLRKEMSKNSVDMRADLIHMIESAAVGRHQEIEGVRQGLRDQDIKLETFRREITSAVAQLAQKEDLRRLEAKIDQILSSASALALEVAAIRSREVRRLGEAGGE